MARLIDPGVGDAIDLDDLVDLLAAEPIAGAGYQMTWETTIELEGASKPACVAESVVRRYP